MALGRAGNTRPKRARVNRHAFVGLAPRLPRSSKVVAMRCVPERLATASAIPARFLPAARVNARSTALSVSTPTPNGIRAIIRCTATIGAVRLRVPAMAGRMRDKCYPFADSLAFARFRNPARKSPPAYAVA